MGTLKPGASKPTVAAAPATDGSENVSMREVESEIVDISSSSSSSALQSSSKVKLLFAKSKGPFYYIVMSLNFSLCSSNAKSKRQRPRLVCVGRETWEHPLWSSNYAEKLSLVEIPLT